MDSVSAYIPLLTLLQLLDNLKLRYKYKLNYIDQEQIDSLEEKVILFTGFLQSRPEGPHDPQIEPFVLEIYNAVLETCQVLDFHVVDQIRREGDAKEDGGVKWLSAFREDMIKIIRDMELILSKVVGFTFESATLSPESQLPPISADPSSSSSMFKSEDRKVIGFEHHLSWLKDELIASHVKSRKVIPIVGMGGIGKTTLARLVYEDPSIRRRFDKEKLYWVSVSQGYDLLRILQGILNKKDCISIIDLGTELYQKLKGSRYLIVLDDMWDVRAWEDLRQYFPEDNQGSRIIVTTRAKNLADGLADPSSKTYDVGFLNKEKSWELFCDRLFGDKHCPGDLEVFGRQIVENCRGLPLGIITITGLLSKSDMTCKYWSSVSKNVAALVNMEDNEYCRKVLRISYDYLPLYLKPSFLFIGRFYEEDVAISLDQLIRSLVTFAVVSPIPRVPIQQIATYYVRELFQRNLIFIRGSTLGIHDLLRDICLQETSKEKLFARDFAKLDESTKWGMKRICFGIKNKKECTKWILGSKRSFYLVRRVEDIWLCGKCTKEVSHYSAFWNIKDFNNHNDEDNHKGIASEIWNSPQLEYVDFYSVTFPLNERKRPVIFERLQSLTAGVSGWTRDMANTMPNLKDLLLYYHEESTCDVALPPLLESLVLCSVLVGQKWECLNYPQSLTYLRLVTHKISRELVNAFGKLPNLEKLCLSDGEKCHHVVWKPMEDGFRRLKWLEINGGGFCEYWRRGSDIHFPELETLVIAHAFMHEIPRGLKDIVTLTLIDLNRCHEDVVSRARWIVRQQRRSGNDQVRLLVNQEYDGDDKEEDDDDDGDDEEDDDGDEEEESDDDDRKEQGEGDDRKKQNEVEDGDDERRTMRRKMKKMMMAVKKKMKNKMMMVLKKKQK